MWKWSGLPRQIKRYRSGIISIGCAIALNPAGSGTMEFGVGGDRSGDFWGVVGIPHCLAKACGITDTPGMDGDHGMVGSDPASRTCPLTAGKRSDPSTATWPRPNQRQESLPARRGRGRRRGGAPGGLAPGRAVAPHNSFPEPDAATAATRTRAAVLGARRTGRAPFH